MCQQSPSPNSPHSLFLTICSISPEMEARIDAEWREWCQRHLWETEDYES